MPTGFFAPTALPMVKVQQYRTAQCGKCGLSKTCKSPKMQPTGRGRRKILVIAEAPGETEDREGRQLIGPAGVEVRDTFARHGVDLHSDCWLTNAVICRPPGNRLDKHPHAVDYCRPNLIDTVRDLNPEVIVLFGAAACDSLLGHLWKDDVGGVGRWVGYRIPDRTLNAWVCPTFHPSYLIRDRDKRQIESRLFDRHLAAVAGLTGRPYKAVPDYAKEVHVEHSPTGAAYNLGWLDLTRPIAFDYETTTLKPDGPQAEIVCCSVSDGNVTMAFPWHGAAVKAMKKLLEDGSVKKIGYNCFSGNTKFLTREYGNVEFKKVLGREVTVLNHEGRWVSGTVRCFGMQRLHKTVFTRRNYVKEVWCTAGHEWLLADTGSRVPTESLRDKIYGEGRPGARADRLPYQPAPKMVEDEIEYVEGVRHGAVLGDGTRVKRKRGLYVLRLCGDKNELLPFFDGFTRSYPPSACGDAVIYLSRQNTDLKKPPRARLVSESYMIGFARGLLATDGCVNFAGQASLSNSEEVIAWCKKHLPRVGYLFQGEHGTMQYAGKYPGGFNRTREVRTLYFSRESVQEEDLLLGKHRRYYRPVQLGPFKFKEFSKDAVAIENVYCVSVPDGASFTLDNGLVTGNCKFEDRWSRRNGIEVRGWFWDGMLAAHALDNGGKGRAVTGLKFQAYVRLGVGDYDSHVKPYLKSDGKGGNRPNRVKDVDMDSLLLYCGIDSLVEYKVAEHQMRQLKEGDGAAED